MTPLALAVLAAESADAAGSVWEHAGEVLGGLVVVATTAYSIYLKLRPKVEQTVKTVFDDTSIEVTNKGPVGAVPVPSSEDAVHQHYQEIMKQQGDLMKQQGEIINGYRVDVAEFRAERAKDSATIQSQAHDIAVKEQTIEQLQDLIRDLRSQAAQNELVAARNQRRIADLEQQVSVLTLELASMKTQKEN